MQMHSASAAGLLKRMMAEPAAQAAGVAVMTQAALKLSTFSNAQVIYASLFQAIDML